MKALIARWNRQATTALAFLCITVVLAACSRPIFIPPNSVATLETRDSWTNSPPYPCPPATGGLFQFNPDEANLEVGAGVHLFFDEGTLPFPCQESHGVLAKANVVFDHEELRVLTFDKAWLKFRLSSTGVPIGGPALTGGGCLLKLGVATEAWPSGVTRLRNGAPGSRPGYTLLTSPTPIAFLLREPLPTGFVPATDVTATVLSWMDGTSENHGFVLIPFAAPDSTEEIELGRLRRLNASCTAFANDFRLEVTRGP